MLPMIMAVLLPVNWSSSLGLRYLADAFPFTCKTARMHSVKAKMLANVDDE
jgi:hypothetical protein